MKESLSVMWQLLPESLFCGGALPANVIYRWQWWITLLNILFLTCRWQHCAVFKLTQILLKNNNHLSFSSSKCGTLNCICIPETKKKYFSKALFSSLYFILQISLIYILSYCSFVIDRQKHRCSFCDSYRRRGEKEAYNLNLWIWLTLHSLFSLLFLCALIKYRIKGFKFQLSLIFF